MIDKYKHFVVSFAIVFVLKLVLTLTMAIAITLLIGVLKEVYDYYFKTTGFDWYDILADITGIIVGVCV